MSLSLIIPNYNNERYLRKCLDSVLGQTLIPNEIIIADDASKDNSVKIIKEYEKKYDFVKGIYNQTNKGVSLNRHNAILSARSEYITTLDSDDYFYNRKKLENEMELINYYKKKYQKEIIPYSNVKIVDISGKDIGNFFNKNNTMEGNIFFTVISRNNSRLPRDFVMKKQQYLNTGGYDPRLYIYEDWDLKIRLAKKYEFYYTNEMGIAHRENKDGLSSANYRIHIKYLNKVFIKNFKSINKRDRLFISTRFYYYVLKKLIINKFRKGDK